METSTLTRDEKILEWKNAKVQLDAFKTLEMKLRSELVSENFDGSKLEGTENLDLGNSWKLKCVKKLSHKLTNKNGETAKALVALPSHISERLVKWEPTLSVSEYKRLDPAHRAIIDEVLTIKEASPSLDLVAPKA